MNELEKAIVRKLQEDIPLVKEPYKYIAEELGISEHELLDKIEALKSQKALRRVGAMLHHRTAGFKANAMVIWEVAEDSIKQVTDLMISFDEVSHCYQRQTMPEWPYNIYTMIHAKTLKGCETIISTLLSKTDICKYEVLYSTKELKKSSMKYFTEID